MMTGKILLVDDDPIILKSLSNILKCEDFLVDAANGGIEAIKLFKSDSFDLIITDINMPGMDGIELIQKIKAVDKNQEIIVLTGFASLDNAIRIIKTGEIYDYISKPITNIDSFIHTVNNAIMHQKLRQEKKILFEELQKNKTNLQETVRVLEEEIEARKFAEKDREKLISELKTSENKFRATLDVTPFPMAVVDLQDDKIVYWSRSAFKLFGHTAPTTSKWYQIAYPDPDYRQEVIDRWKPFLKTARDSVQPVNTGEYQVMCKDGSIRICELYATFLPDNLIVTFNDITERKQTEEKLTESEERYRSIFENAVEGLFQSTPEGRFISVNPSFARMLGYASPEALVSSTSDITKQYYVNSEDRHRYEQLLQTTGFVENFEYRVRCKDGSHIWVSDNTRAIYDRDGKIARYEGYVTDITDQMQVKQELKLLNLKLKHEATHDPLTGALNRRAILDNLTKELIRAKRKNTKVSIGLCDIDHFKLVNDKYGHQVGDDVLCSFVKVMQNTFRPYDLLSRYGGEEFLLVIPDSTMSAEECIYERLRAKIADHKIMTRSGGVSITVSIGITSSTGDETADAMIAKADTALYRAKENGRNQVVFIE